MIRSVAPEILLNTKLVESLLEANHKIFEFLPMEFQREEMALKAVKGDRRYLRFVAPQFRARVLQRIESAEVAPPVIGKPKKKSMLSDEW